MGIKEKEMRYREALRYLENAAKILSTKAGKEGKYYHDGKYVRMACGTTYNGTLLALDTFLEIKGKTIKRKKKNSGISVDAYRKKLALIDKKILKTFNTTYEILHLVGYYEGETNYSVIQAGMDSALHVVNHIKPARLEGISLN